MKKAGLLFLLFFTMGVLPIHGEEGVVSMYVVSETQHPIQGATFILHLNGEVYQTDIQSDEKGCVKLKELPSGTYSLRQVATQDGYEIDEESHVFYYQSGQTLQLPDVVNLEMLASIQIKLVDGAGMPLANEAFFLSKGEDQVAFESDEQGCCVIEALRLGEYIIKVRDKTTSVLITKKNYKEQYEVQIYAEKKLDDFEEKQPSHVTSYLFVGGTLCLLVGVSVLIKKTNFMKWLHETDQS